MKIGDLLQCRRHPERLALILDSNLYTFNRVKARVWYNNNKFVESRAPTMIYPEHWKKVCKE
jgi:hypothetical protein